MPRETNSIHDTSYQTIRNIFLKPLAANRLIREANSRYQSAKIATADAKTGQAKYYWQGYQDALHYLLRESQLMRELD